MNWEKPEKTLIFKCPFYGVCNKERVVSWHAEDNVKIAALNECKAPLLAHRKTGQTICQIMMDTDKLNNWSVAIEDIGRRKRRENNGRTKNGNSGNQRGDSRRNAKKG